MWTGVCMDGICCQGLGCPRLQPRMIMWPLDPECRPSPCHMPILCWILGDWLTTCINIHAHVAVLQKHPRGRVRKTKPAEAVFNFDLLLCLLQHYLLPVCESFLQGPRWEMALTSLCHASCLQVHHQGFVSSGQKAGIPDLTCKAPLPRALSLPESGNAPLT